MSTVSMSFAPDTTNNLLPTEKLIPSAVLVKAQEAAKQIVLSPTHPESIMAIGAAAAQSSTRASGDLLNHVKNNDTGDIGSLLVNLSTHCKAVDTRKLTPGWRDTLAHVPMIGRMFAEAQNVLGGYEDTVKTIDGIGSQLTQASNRLHQDVVSLGALYDQNLDFYRSLQQWVEVCRLKLEEVDGEIATFTKTPSPEETQQLRDLQTMRNALDKRKSDLELMSMTRLQNAPKIRIVQAGDMALAEKLQSSVLTTIPLWRDNLALAITQVRQKRALELQNQVDDTTNSLIRQSADMLHENTVGVAKAANRGVVDIETLEYSQKQLISTIEDTKKIQEDGVKAREDARRSMEKMVVELQQQALHA